MREELSREQVDYCTEMMKRDGISFNQTMILRSLREAITALRASRDAERERAEQAEEIIEIKERDQERSNRKILELEQQLADLTATLEAMTHERDELRLRRQETINMAVQLEQEIAHCRGQRAEAQATVTAQAEEIKGLREALELAQRALRVGDVDALPVIEQALAAKEGA